MNSNIENIDFQSFYEGKKMLVCKMFLKQKNFKYSLKILFAGRDFPKTKT